MNRKLFRFALAAMTLSSLGALSQEKNALVVQMKNGTSTVFQLNHLPKAMFVEGCLRVSSAELTMDFLREQVQRFTYSYVDPEGVTIMPLEKFHGVIQGNVFCLTGLEGNATVRIISMDGRLLSEVRTNNDGKVNIPIDAYPSGVYVLQTKGVIHKFTKP